MTDVPLRLNPGLALATQAARSGTGNVLLLEIWRADIVRQIEMTPSEAAQLAQALWTEAGLAPIGMTVTKLRGLIFVEDDGSVRFPTTRDI